MAFYKKRHLLEALVPDVAIIQEVSKKDIESGGYPFAAWVGANPSKGLGVIGLRHASNKVMEPSDPALPWHIPFSVDGLNIIGLWAHQLTGELRYVRITHEIVDRHAGFLGSGRALIAGDFNSNTIWDREHPGRNHSMLVDKLAGLGLESVFHRQESADHGSEMTKTYFHTRNLKFGHHIDYAFLSSAMDAKVAVGEPDRWLPHSDHMPLIIDVT
ncbi:endonuclease/exonuclease/phosphatase family protein [Arthrobacter globiformis]|uniref:endonuclease/exonuclease/phosphatase family protein n=1 Tax=Arthrobacter globiformis TaxID=1665 RepID=UPI0027D88351|nr:endonuclease/exonuclease/phosphatase family protein [Arthrobacter globiformis]